MHGVWKTVFAHTKLIERSVSSLGFVNEQDNSRSEGEDKTMDTG